MPTARRLLRANACGSRPGRDFSNSSSMDAASRDRHADRTASSSSPWTAKCRYAALGETPTCLMREDQRWRVRVARRADHPPEIAAFVPALETRRNHPTPCSPSMTAWLTFTRPSRGSLALRAAYPDPGHPTRLHTLTLLIRWSGLRIRAGVTLECHRLHGDSLLLYQAKTGMPAYVPLPSFLIKALHSLPPWPKPTPCYFSGAATATRRALSPTGSATIAVSSN
jgi:hypothetical protein